MWLDSLWSVIFGGLCGTLVNRFLLSLYSRKVVDLIKVRFPLLEKQKIKLK